MNGRLEHELKINKNIKDNLSSMPDYVYAFYMHIQSSKSPNTCRNYINTIKRFLEFTNYQDIVLTSEETIQDFLESIKFIKDKDGTIKKSSTAYIKLTCSSLNAFFKFLYRKKIVKENPMEYIERPMKKDIVDRTFLSMKDLNKILREVWNSNDDNIWKVRDYTIIYLFMVTGMRNTALSEINTSSFDWENNTLTVVDKRDKLQVYTITSENKKVLLRWENSRSNLLDREKIKEDAFFISKKRNRLSQKAIYSIVTKYTEKALGKPYSPHKLRAAFVSLYYDKTKDIEATRRAVGHADVKTTSLYITMKNNPREDAAEFMSEGLKCNL